MIAIKFLNSIAIGQILEASITIDSRNTVLSGRIRPSYRPKMCSPFDRGLVDRVMTPILVQNIAAFNDTLSLKNLLTDCTEGKGTWGGLGEGEKCLPITILKSNDHNFELERDLEVGNRRLSIVVSKPACPFVLLPFLARREAAE